MKLKHMLLLKLLCCLLLRGSPFMVCDLSVHDGDDVLCQCAECVVCEFYRRGPTMLRTLLWPHPHSALPCGTHKIQPSRRAATTDRRAKSGNVGQPHKHCDHDQRGPGRSEKKRRQLMCALRLQSTNIYYLQGRTNFHLGFLLDW